MAFDLEELKKRITRVRDRNFYCKYKVAAYNDVLNIIAEMKQLTFADLDYGDFFTFNPDDKPVVSPNQKVGHDIYRTLTGLHLSSEFSVCPDTKVNKLTVIFTRAPEGKQPTRIPTHGMSASAQLEYEENKDE